MKNLFRWMGAASILAIMLSGCVKTDIQYRCCNGEIEIITQNFAKPDSFYLYAPQAFTPNGDGRNEQFYPVGVGWDLEKLIIKKGIRTVYESTNRLDAFWDGGDEKDGRYRYEMIFKTSKGDEFEAKGNVCVMRYGSAGAKHYDIEREQICECVTEDMLDSIQGSIYITPECPSNLQNDSLANDSI
jgi:hypothetical protein